MSDEDPDPHRACRLRPVQVPAVACTPRTPWPVRPRRWARPCRGRRPRRQSMPGARSWLGRPGLRWWGSIRQGITTRDIITRRSLENAITVVMALGGLDQRWSCTCLRSPMQRRHPPGPGRLPGHQRAGAAARPAPEALRGVREDPTSIEWGGVPVVMGMLAEQGLLHLDCLTVTGRTLGENLAAMAPLERTAGSCGHGRDPGTHRRHRDPLRVAGTPGRGGEGGGRCRARPSRALQRLRPGGGGDGRLCGRFRSAQETSW
jgi:hypothetical protein